MLPLPGTGQRRFLHLVTCQKLRKIDGGGEAGKEWGKRERGDGEKERKRERQVEGEKETG